VIGLGRKAALGEAGRAKSSKKKKNRGGNFKRPVKELVRTRLRLTGEKESRQQSLPCTRRKRGSESFLGGREVKENREDKSLKKIYWDTESKKRKGGSPLKELEKIEKRQAWHAPSCGGGDSMFEAGSEGGAARLDGHQRKPA